MMLATKLDTIFKIAASAKQAVAATPAPASSSGYKSEEVFSKLSSSLDKLDDASRKQYISKVKGSFTFNIKVCQLSATERNLIV